MQQVATNPFSANLSYHPYYHIHPTAPQDHDLKRQYLALLPPHQIIEICLTFDPHVPHYIKSSIWPPDINAAILALKNVHVLPKSAPPAQGPSKDSTPAVMDSLQSSSLEAQESSISAEIRPPDKQGPSISKNAPSENELKGPTPELSSQPTAPAKSTSKLGQTSYPLQPYGFGHPTATYPYYPQPATYSYPYQPYPTPIQNAYHPHTQPQAPPMSGPSGPQQVPDGLVDDLPSYEEMIVEGLSGCGDPEGWAPKELFAWMASHYPVQSNFRPSASQALQKAYKRGRFEKSSGGKYRLNPAWEGGNTTRRTTRRPQIYTSQPPQANPTPTPPPPFTNTPLVPRHGQTVQQPHPNPFQPHPYGYPYPGMGYPGFPGQLQAHPQASTSTAPIGAPSSTSVDDKALLPLNNGNKEGDSTSADAYEAAKTILSAINFGSMYQLAPEGRQAPEGNDDAGDGAASSGVENLLSHVQAILAGVVTAPSPGQVQEDSSALQKAQNQPSAQLIQHPLPTNLSTNPPIHGDSAASPPSDPRAELQAQFALLAAQLAELAQLELADTHALHQNQNQKASLAPPQDQAMDHLSPPSQALRAQTPVPAPSAAVPPAVAPAPMAKEAEESDDDDMEEVI